MTTLRARIGELDRHLRGHREDEAEQLAVGKTQRVARAASGHAARSARLTPSVAELRRAGIEVETPSALDLITDAIEEAREQSRADGLAAGRGDEPSVVRLAKAVADETAAAVKPAWQRLKAHERPPKIDEELLSIAAADEPAIEQRYELTKTALLPLLEKQEPGEGDVQRWRELVAELRTVEGQVSAAAPSEDVRTFLTEAASQHGASLDWMDSEDVRQWLSHGERRSRFRIFARGR